MSSFEYTYADEEGEKTFDLTYNFTPGERAVYYGDNAHPEWPAEIDIHKAVCIEVDGLLIPAFSEARNDLGKLFIKHLNEELRAKIEEEILQDIEERSQGYRD